MSSILELFLTFGLGIIISAFAFLFARKSLTDSDDSCSIKEDSKFKNKISKPPVKVKAAKKDVNNNKSKPILKSETKSAIIESINKNHETLQEVAEKITITAIERNRNDSTAEWTKVMKIAKKPKKETKQEIDTSSVDEIKVPIKENEIIKPNLIIEKDNANKQKKEVVQGKSKSKEILTNKVEEKSNESSKSVKTKKTMTIESEISNKEEKTKASIVEVKPSIIVKEEDELKQKINEMMTELDKMKNSQKDESKMSTQSIKELDSLKLKLKISQEKEEKLQEDLKKKGQAVTDLKNQFLIIQSELTKNIVANQSVVRDKLSLENRLRKLEEESRTMKEQCHILEQLQIENENLVKNFTAIDNELKFVKQESAEQLKSREMELLKENSLLQCDKQRIQEQLLRVQSDLIENNSKMQSAHQDLLANKNAQADLLNDHVRLQKSFADLEQLTLLDKQHDLTNYEHRINQYDDQIATLNNEITSSKAVNSDLTSQIFNLLNQIDQFNHDKLLSDNADHLLLSQKIEALNQEIIILKQELSESQVNSDHYKTMCDELSLQLKEITIERDNITCLVEQYKTGLESTELILSKLQTSVNEEEYKWRESLIKSETEAEKSKKELEIVYNDLMRIRNCRAEKNELNFAYHCVDKSLSSLIDEMEARMIHFENSLETVVQERDNALAQISSQINGVSDNHEHSESNQNQLVDLSELEKLKTDLNNQMEINKILENQCNKFRSLIDIGKDALNEEQNHVKDLQEQLISLQSPCSPVSIINNGEINSLNSTSS